MERGSHAKSRPVYRNEVPDFQGCLDAICAGLQVSVLGGSGAKRTSHELGCALATVYAFVNGDDVPSMRQFIGSMVTALGNPEKSREEALAPLTNLNRCFGLLTRPIEGVGTGSVERSTGDLLRAVGEVLGALADKSSPESLKALRAAIDAALAAQADHEREPVGIRSIRDRKEGVA